VPTFPHWHSAINSSTRRHLVARSVQGPASLDGGPRADEEP